MSLTELFKGIQEFADATLLAPFNALAEVELSNWWLANGLNWIFMLICIAALTYWMFELKKYNDEGTEQREAKAHGFLGPDSELESRL